MNVHWFYSSVGGYFNDQSPSIIGDDSAIYEYDGDRVKWLYSNSNIEDWRLIDGEILAQYRDGEVVDLSNESKSLENQFLINDHVKINDTYALIESVSDDEDYIVTINSLTNEQKKLQGEWFIGINTDGLNIYVKDHHDLVAYNLDLEELWRDDIWSNRDKGDHHALSKRTQYYFTNNLVVTNIGICKDTHIGNIVALSNKNGEEVWSYEYSGSPEYSFMKGEHYYIVLNGDIIVLDAKSGKIMDTHSPQLGSEIFVSVQDDYFLIGSNNQRSLSIYEISKKSITSSKSLPEGYKLRLNRMPNETKDFSYFSIEPDHPSLNYCYTGLVSVPNTGKLDEFNLESRLDMPMMLTQDSSGERVYVFTVSCDSLGDLRRLAAVNLAEFAHVYGEPTGVSITKIDENHKGKIKLVVDKTGLPDDAETQLKEWADQLHRTLTLIFQ